MPLTQQLIQNAEADIAALAAIVNGDATAPDTATRLGGFVPSIRKILAPFLLIPATAVSAATAAAAAAAAILSRNAAQASATNAANAAKDGVAAAIALNPDWGAQASADLATLRQALIDLQARVEECCDGHTGGGDTGGTPGGIGAARFANGAEGFVPALATVDSPHIVLSYWINYFDDDSRGGATPYVSDPDDYYMTWGGAWNSGARANKLAAGFGEGVSGNSLSFEGAQVMALNAWTHVLLVFRGVADGAHANQLVAYENGVLNPGLVNYFDNGLSLVPELGGRPFYVGSNSYGGTAVFDLAEFWMDVGTEILEADGTISPANIAKFYNAGDPVPLGANGELPFGAAPVLYLHRDAAAAPDTFLDNLGTGGAMTKNGSLFEPDSNPGA